MLATPTEGFTLPIYAHDMAMLLAAQPSPTEASTPSPSYDPRALDFFDLSAEVDNECYSLDSTQMMAAMRVVSLEVGNLVVTTSRLSDFWFD